MPITNAADGILIFSLVFFRKSKTRHFTVNLLPWLADDSHEMPSLIFSEKKKPKKKQQPKMSAAILLGALRMKTVQVKEQQSHAITVFTLNIGTPYLITTLILKFEKVFFTSCWCVYNYYCWMSGKQCRDILWHLIWVYTVCSACLSKYAG